MAYFIFNNEGYLYKIAADDTAKTNLGLDESKWDVRSVSTEDFNKIRNNEVDKAVVENDAIVFVDHKEREGFDPNIQDQNEMDGLISIHKHACISFLDAAESSAPNYSDYQNYKNYLDSFDSSSLTYPLSVKTWEQYCIDNSITFYHPLQIP
tara:strand:+ start:950 stop:1405 length:456 start_codon:yes stop_codon:yes gene_type:complete